MNHRITWACALLLALSVLVCPRPASADDQPRVLLTVMTPELAVMLGGHTYVDRDTISACPWRLDRGAVYVVELNWTPIGLPGSTPELRTERTFVEGDAFGSARCLTVWLDPVTERANQDGYSTRLYQTEVVWDGQGGGQ